MAEVPKDRRILEGRATRRGVIAEVNPDRFEKGDRVSVNIRYPNSRNRRPSRMVTGVITSQPFIAEWGPLEGRVVAFVKVESNVVSSPPSASASGAGGGERRVRRGMFGFLRRGGPEGEG